MTKLYFLLAITLNIYQSATSFASEGKDVCLKNVLDSYVQQSKRKKTLTEGAGEKFSLDIKVNGINRSFEGHTAPEVERRVDLPDFPIKVKDKNQNSVQINNQDELLIDLLDHFSRPERYYPDGNPIMLNPLASKSTRFHVYSKEKKDIKKMGTQKKEDEYLTTELKGNEYEWLSNQAHYLEKYVHPERLKSLRGYGDHYQREYIVGRQFEKSTYYDTPTKLPFALRVKEWYGINPIDGARTEKPIHRMLFIKTLPDLNLKDSLATHRMEYQVTIPNDLKASELDQLMRKLMKEVKDLDLSSEVKIQAMVEVENTRYGIDIVQTGQNGWQNHKSHVKPKKVGFMTIDNYTRREIGKDRDPSVIQFEYELLPKYQKLIVTMKDEFEEFFDLIEKRYSSVPNPIPKYIKKE